MIRRAVWRKFSVCSLTRRALQPGRRGRRAEAEQAGRRAAYLPLRAAAGEARAALMEDENAGLSAILTGMGEDGAAGLLAMRQTGSPTFGQSEASCVVYGMPRAAMALGAVARELPLTSLAAPILAACRQPAINQKA